MTQTAENPLSRLKLFSDEEVKNRRSAAKRGKKALENLREIFEIMDADTSITDGLIRSLDQQIDRLNPPNLKKCKEYVRALKRAEKGLPGIEPEDVVLYCTCFECRDVRERFGLEQPIGEDVDALLEKKIAEKLAEAEAEARGEAAEALEDEVDAESLEETA